MFVYNDDLEDYYGKDLISEKLNKNNSKYDENTIIYLKKELSNQRKSKYSDLKDINNMLLNNNNSSNNKIINHFDEMDNENDIITKGIELNDFEILNIESLSEKIVNSFILNQCYPIKNEIIYHEFNNNQMNELLSWEYYFYIENNMSPIFFEISKILNEFNNIIENRNNPEKLIKELINYKPTEEFNLNEFQIILKISYLLPLIKLSIKHSKSFININLDTLFEIKISNLIKNIEDFFSTCMEKLIIYNSNKDLIFCFFILNFDKNESFVPFFVFLLNKEDYDKILLKYINKNIEEEDENDYHFFNMENNKKSKKKKILELSDDLIKKNQKIELLRFDFSYLDNIKKNQNIPKWKKSITDSNVQFLNYGYMTTGY